MIANLLFMRYLHLCLFTMGEITGQIGAFSLGWQLVSYTNSVPSPAIEKINEVTMNCGTILSTL